MMQQIFTDATHLQGLREVFDAPAVPGAITLTPEGNALRDFRGFGVALTGSSCYCLSQMDPTERRTLLERIYTDAGLGLSVARLTVGSSDYSAELYSYDDTPFDTELKDFSIERDEAYVIPMIKEVLEVKPDLFLFASPWSPPGWMKTGGSLCGGYMREEFVPCYVEYLIKYLRAYRERGIVISALTIQNEPETAQSGRMPACIWHPETQARMLKLLRRRLDEERLEVELWAYDHNFSGARELLWLLENSPGLAESLHGVAFHYYRGAIEETLILRDRYPQLQLHFTEGGPRLVDHYATDHCKWAMMISRALAAGYRSFTGWNLLLDETGGPNIGPFLCGGLLTRDQRSGALSESGQYRAFAHVAPYLLPGSQVRRLASSEAWEGAMFRYPAHSPRVEGFLIEREGAPKVAVLINACDEKRQVNLRLGEQSVYVELPPDSVSTVILN